MICQNDVPQYISKELPELEQQLIQTEKPTGIYQVMHLLADYTSSTLREQNYQRVQRCFGVVERLYAKGDGIIRCAVENVYIYALDKILMACNCDKKKVQSMLPGNLYTVYVGQMVNSNI
jgi:hypothetical protein